MGGWDKKYNLSADLESAAVELSRVLSVLSLGYGVKVFVVSVESW